MFVAGSVLCDTSYSPLTIAPIVCIGRRPTMAIHASMEEAIMPSNQEYKGKGIKGGNYDELSGVGTSSAGKTGTTGNLNDGGRDGGVGAPDAGDAGNLQSAGQGQPGGTPAQGRSSRGQGNQQNSDLASGPGDNAQQGDTGNLQGERGQGNQSQSDLASGPGDNSQRGNR